MSGLGANNFVAPAADNSSNSLAPATTSGISTQSAGKGGVSDVFFNSVCGLGSAAGTYASNSQAANSAWGAAGATQNPNMMRQQAEALADRQIPDIASTTENKIREALAGAGVGEGVTEEVVREMMDGNPKTGAPGVVETAAALREDCKGKYVQAFQAVAQSPNNEQKLAILKTAGSDIQNSIGNYQGKLQTVALEKATNLQTKNETKRNSAAADEQMAASQDDDGPPVSAHDVLQTAT